ncbi:hypothetical protein HCA61_18625 [Rhodococcus sp. HNM0563]|uniref:hypothetical protein n=1 Tax=Rhodococcus sp. HNM0563 TaxID=2716339 RepID=UPI00146C2CC3|nr:hypothetical protein [Rhodococcus sp. HNM0563]NLU64264.1 hypothetical protein [Rhodococcus sp. HNM0563]
MTIGENPLREDGLAVQSTGRLHTVLDHHKHRYDATIDRIANRKISATTEILAGSDLYIWCRDDTLIGPIGYKLDEKYFTVAADDQRLSRVPIRKDENAVFRFPGRIYCAPETLPTGYLDCRPDVAVVRTAIRDAVEIAEARTNDVPDFLQTRALMQHAANALRVGEDLDDRKFRFERMARAIKIIQDSNDIREEAEELATLVLNHPSIRDGVEEHRRRIQAEIARTARETVEAELKHETAQLERIRREVAELERQHADAFASLEQTRQQTADAEAAVDTQLASLESSIVERIADAVDNASDLLSDSVIFRALGNSKSTPRPEAFVRTNVSFATTENAPTVQKAVDFDTVLYRTAADQNLSHSALRRIHAAVRAGLIPIATGNGSSAALNAYANAAFAARIAELPVAHDFLSPVDLLGVRASDTTTRRAHSDLLLAANREAEKNGPSLLILESANQAPTESFLLPWLRSHDRSIAVPPTLQDIVGSRRVQIHENLRIAATAVSGTTTAPLSPDIWGFCVAIDVPQPRPGSPKISEPTQLVPDAPVPTSDHVARLVDDLDDAFDECWMIDNAIDDAARRFGEALHQVVHADSIAYAIAECVLVPALATSVPAAGLNDALDAVGMWCGADSTQMRGIRRLAHRLQRTFT